MTTIWSLILPSYVEENEVGQQYMKEKDVDELALEFSTLTHLPFENLTLVEEEEILVWLQSDHPFHQLF